VDLSINEAKGNLSIWDIRSVEENNAKPNPNNK